ncbi:DUF4249 domain-containing protein [Maribellus sp. YY47]|uniref:DUF4249 domain-containing protein n=1 Tax=Maribellus sp. YY47 TaxID=2929486 RepID=UPI002000DFE5|nr:DUF4249 domain-containing protein [Maribellus sp. YY47]MCK3684260.1 DUF4249 domain-containing protein [Maribellus sp. YY47]
MKKTYLYRAILLSLLTALILVSCEDIVEVDLNDEDIDLFAVEAYINTKPADNVYVKIEKTLQVDQAATNPAVNSAIVEISDDETVPNTVILKEQGNTGIYKLPENTVYEAVPGRTYHLTITTTDGTVITATEYLQHVETLDKTKINLSARGDYEFLAVFINSQETPGEGNYYKWDIYINNELLYESEYLAFASDELVDGNYIYDFEILTDFEDKEEDKVFHMGDTVRVEQLSISEASYDFYFGLINQAFSGSPFSVPPANVPGNLTSSDGKRVLGLFSARDISVGESIVIDENNYKPLISSIPPGI